MLTVYICMTSALRLLGEHLASCQVRRLHDGVRRYPIIPSFSSATDLPARLPSLPHLGVAPTVRILNLSDFRVEEELLGEVQSLEKRNEDGRSWILEMSSIRQPLEGFSGAFPLEIDRVSYRNLRRIDECNRYCALLNSVRVSFEFGAI